MEYKFRNGSGKQWALDLHRPPHYHRGEFYLVFKNRICYFCNINLESVMGLRIKFRYMLTCCLYALYLQGCAMATQEEGPLTAKQYQQKLKDNSSETVQLIDVRTADEFADGHLEHALNIDIKDNDFDKEVSRLDRTKPVFVYCLGGSRSAKATATLKELGFKEIYDLKGGIMAWKNENLPVTPGEKPVKKDLFTKTDFDKILHENKVVLIDFYADWCIPCKEMEPTLKKLAKEYEGKVFIYRLNIDQAKALTRAMKVEGIPVFHLYKQGKLVKEAQGFQQEEQLRNLLKSI
ncbi:thioredoxin domain-containing protein [Olivibacter sp. SA151]|uniref:Rhodanese-like protein n=1 Tax=Sphingobacterium sp. (strain 21) TaxID=743722 RepID=F4C4Z4_SPHS2